MTRCMTLKLCKYGYVNYRCKYFVKQFLVQQSDTLFRVKQQQAEFKVLLTTYRISTS